MRFLTAGLVVFSAMLGTAAIDGVRGSAALQVAADPCVAGKPVLGCDCSSVSCNKDGTVVPEACKGKGFQNIGMYQDFSCTNGLCAASPIKKGDDGCATL